MFYDLYYLHKVYILHVKINFFMMAKSDLYLDPHLFEVKSRIRIRIGSMRINNNG